MIERKKYIITKHLLIMIRMNVGNTTKTATILKNKILKYDIVIQRQNTAYIFITL